MLIEDQNVKISWTNSNKEWFINKGYTFTKNRDLFFVKPTDLVPSSKIMVYVKCDYCGEVFKKQYSNYLKDVNGFIKKTACKSCHGRKISEIRKEKEYDNRYKKFLSFCKSNNYTPISKEYKGNKNYIEFECPKHGLQKIKYYNISKRICPKCEEEFNDIEYKKEKIKEFENECKRKGYISLATVDLYENIDTPLPYICSMHGKKFISLHNIKYGDRGCRECGRLIYKSKMRLDNETVRSTIESKNNNVWINQDEYINAITNNLLIKCGSCGEIFSTSLNNYGKNIDGKCRDCSESSYGEYLIALFLKEHKIEHIRQYHFDGNCRDINPLPFDFYLPKYNMCIEFDGEHHYWAVFGDDHFITTKLHDGMKNNYCKWNGIKLLRIPYWERSNLDTVLCKELGLKNNKIMMKYIHINKTA